ncbi:DNA ligase D [Leeuwenhoekiella sp. LLG6367-2.1]|uniref:DNA ligase D n=1 Tax=Leeuwenhoekiella sp. LLG6367-2.1 TaxID=3160833 RepID=UPI003866C923
MSLQKYNDKRDFKNTPEPSGQLDATNSNRFVIQVHKATRLHFDLRLELNGVLKSWAIPKGPSLSTKDKRLAIQTEDHPVSYLNFEGVIPKGNYGAGKMQIWDSGTFEILNDTKKSDPEALLKSGDLKIKFSGDKIRGDFALVRIKNSKSTNQWLLIKKQDAFSTSLDYDIDLPDFALPKVKSEASQPKIKIDQVIKPMLATPTKEIFNNPNWIYEIKWDGYRLISHVNEGKVTLQSRNGQEYTSKFDLITEELKGLSQNVILDGEVVILEENGLPNFQKLQNYEAGVTKGVLRYYVFDVIYLNGYDMQKLPLIDRKSLLPEILEGLEYCKYCDHVEGMGTMFYNQAIESGLEGVIAKKKDSLYYPGIRFEHWLKIKNIESDEFLICGYTTPTNKHDHFGSLILGNYVDDKLTYAGNCGTGFSNEMKKDLLAKFNEFETTESPFSEKITLKGRKPHWMLPKLVCEVKFMEQTENGLLRHPVFKGLRFDKELKKNVSSSPAKEVKTNIDKSSISSDSVLNINSTSVSITNIEKIYWPETGYMKYDLIDYYLNISDFIIPYLVDRPQNLHRHPNGIKESGFYQKDNEYLPDWIESYSIYSKSADRDINYLLCQNEQTLIYMANLGCIELNPWNSKITSLDSPDYGIIDLDPSLKNSFEEVIEVAQAVKEVLTKAGIAGYCKTSGSTGLHIYIPMGGDYSYEEVRNFIKLLCIYVHQLVPEITSMERNLKKRGAKIYLDYLQNRRGQTLAAAYCVRPKKYATVSTPLKWNEVTQGLKIKDFTIKTTPERLQDYGDLFINVLKEGIDMESALQKLES